MKMTDRSADVSRLTGAAGPRLSASAPKLNGCGPRLASEGAPRLTGAEARGLKSAGASRLMNAGAPRLTSAGAAPRNKRAGAPKPGADAPKPSADARKLYPDLTEFYAPGASSDDRPSSPADLGASSPQPPQVHTHHLLPSAPPLWVGDPRDNDTLHAGEDLSWEDFVELAPDYDTDMEDPDPDTVMLNHLNDLSNHLDVTIDYSIQGLSWDDLLELEPDYDDANADDPGHHHHHHHQDNLNQLLNNLNVTAGEEGKPKILHDKNIELPPPDEAPSSRGPPPRLRPPTRHPPPPARNSQQPIKDDRDFRAWLTWRLQANKQLAAVILTQQGRKHVLVRQSELRRKPLTRHVVQKVVQKARGGGGGGSGGGEGRRGAGEGKGGRGGVRGRGGADRTSLPACPYVMYGIPRVNLPANPSSAATLTTTITTTTTNTTTNQP